MKKLIAGFIAGVAIFLAILSSVSANYTQVVSAEETKIVKTNSTAAIIASVEYDNRSIRVLPYKEAIIHRNPVVSIPTTTSEQNQGITISQYPGKTLNRHEEVVAVSVGVSKTNSNSGIPIVIQEQEGKIESSAQKAKAINSETTLKSKETKQIEKTKQKKSLIKSIFGWLRG